MLSLKEVIRPTTFIVSSKLRDRLGLDITIATESFQHTGSFKFRAAYNLAANVENNALLTASSGNFGQALAYACKLMGKKCTVVMPQTSAQVKIDAVRGFGATVDLIDTTKVARKERVSQLAEQIPDAYLASAYDDNLVIEGNATLGDELSGNGFDTIIVPVGGGGLIAGIVQGLCRNGDSATVFGAEPLLGNDAARSFRAGKIIPNESEPETIADGARTVSIGDLNWPIIRDGVKGFIEVPETAISEAVRHYFELANLKSEPTGALSLGALLIDPQRFVGKRVCVIVSGGNVDTELYTKIIDRSANASFVK
ncbi:MAG: threonine/serine dehydratase [Blastocatellia bacterium]|nr:threonine/serine dehydratase [Blastocatellia bacterium]